MKYSFLTSCCVLALLLSPPASAADPVTPGSGSTPNATGAPDGPVPWIAVFTEHLSRASEWSAVPLAIVVPASIRDNVVSLADGIKAEAYKTPQASMASYASAHAICRTLIASLDEREAILKQSRQVNGGNLSASWNVAWDDRTQYYRNAIRAEYARFSDAVLKSQPPTSPPESGLMASISFPPVPSANAPAAPARRKKGGGNGNGGQAPNVASSTASIGAKGGLNSGAYDKRYIWRSWWGRTIR